MHDPACRACRSALSLMAWSRIRLWSRLSPPPASAANRSSATWSSTTSPTPGKSLSRRSEFGAPLLDLDAVQADFEMVRLVNERTLRKHRVLPLVKRGKRLFVAISDPTNLHALDEVKFATGLSVEAIVVEDDKLEKLLTRSLEQVDTAMPELAGRTKSSTASRSPRTTKPPMKGSSAPTSKTPRSSASSTK